MGISQEGDSHRRRPPPLMSHGTIVLGGGGLEESDNFNARGLVSRGGGRYFFLDGCTCYIHPHPYNGILSKIICHSRPISRGDRIVISARL